MKAQKAAFTLVELLVVFGIIIILVSIISSGIIKVKKHTKNVKCISNLKALYLKSVLFYQDNKEFPSKWSQIDLSFNKDNTKCPSADHYNMIDQHYSVNGTILLDKKISDRFFNINNQDLLFVDSMLNLHNKCSNGIMNSGKMMQLTYNNFGNLLGLDFSRFVAILSLKKDIFNFKLLNMTRITLKDIDDMPQFFLKSKPATKFTHDDMLNHYT